MGVILTQSCKQFRQKMLLSIKFFISIAIFGMLQENRVNGQQDIMGEFIDSVLTPGVRTARPTKAPVKQPSGVYFDSVLTPGTRTTRPTMNPTKRPTEKPTNNPTNEPTQKPTNHPSPYPTTNHPTSNPTQSPTISSMPSMEPTIDAYDMKHLQEPELLWIAQLSGGFETIHGPSLRKGNAVVASVDNRQVYVTSDDGRLHILPSFSKWQGTHVYTPPVIFEGGIEWFTVCYSGVSLAQKEYMQSHRKKDREDHLIGKPVDFAVYAVIDVPPRSMKRQGFITQSRIICVDSKGQEKWIATVDGKIAGTPVISRYEEFVYVNHNTWDGEKNATVGHFTILNQEGALHFTEAVDVFPHARGEWGEWHVRRIDQYYGGSPYGPITRINPIKDRDMLFFGESARDGYGSEGALHRIQVKKTGQVESKIVHVTKGYSASTAVLVAEDGRQVYMPTANSTLMAFTGIERTTVKDENIWNVTLPLSERNRTTAITSKPAIDLDHRRIFVSGAGTSFHCVDARTGEIIWENPPPNATSVVLVEPKLSTSNKIVYTIHHIDGRVVAQDMKTGAILWEFSCFNIDRDRYCQDSVSAEFSLSPDGHVLYYGDIFGRIIALQVGRSNGPTNSPTKIPSFFPSSVPTELPTKFPTTGIPTSDPTTSPSSIPSSFPSEFPSLIPSQMPSNRPSTIPSILPSLFPSTLPSTFPSSNPSALPSSSPSSSKEPTTIPSTIPSSKPSSRPSSQPSISLSPTVNLGILKLESISPEGQAVLVSFMGLSGVIVIALAAVGLFRKSLRRAVVSPEDNDYDGDGNDSHVLEKAVARGTTSRVVGNTDQHSVSSASDSGVSESMNSSSLSGLNSILNDISVDTDFIFNDNTSVDSYITEKSDGAIAAVSVAGSVRPSDDSTSPALPMVSEDSEAELDDIVGENSISIT